MLCMENYEIYILYSGLLRGEGKGIQSTQARAPLGGPCCCQKQRRLDVTCFVLVLVFLDLLRKFPIDIEIEICTWLSLISKRRSPSPNRCL